MTDGDGDAGNNAIETAIRAGAAVFNAGHYHAAHDAWEDYWLDLESGTDDERFLHGLIQFTAAAHHAANGNREGATGLAESAIEYLDGLGATYRGLALEPVRMYLHDVRSAADVGDVPAPTLAHDGQPVATESLTADELAAAARTVAAESDVDRPLVERATDTLETNPDHPVASVLQALVDGADADRVAADLRAHLGKEGP